MYPDERVEMFIRRVCAHISWPLYRERVKLELYDHIMTRAEYLKNERGFNKKEAIAQSILLMGDPDEIGKQLHKAHCSPKRLCFLAITAVIWLLIIGCAFWLFRLLGIGF